MKLKLKLLEATAASDNFSRTEMNLKLFQNRKFSEHTSYASLSSFSLAHPSKLAIYDSNSNSNFNTNIRPNIPVDLGAGTGNTTTSLRPRQHGL